MDAPEAASAGVLMRTVKRMHRICGSPDKLQSALGAPRALHSNVPSPRQSVHLLHPRSLGGFQQVGLAGGEDSVRALWGGTGISF